MKRFEYFKLNFNTAKNETMIAMILAFIAPLFASLGEKESIRSFLMGTDGPSMLQMIAGGVLLVISLIVLLKGTLKVGYDNLFGEEAQLYSAFPIPERTVVIMKLTVLSLNTLIVMVGFIIGTTIGWIFGNNEFIDGAFEWLLLIGTSKVFEKIIIIPLGIILLLTVAIMLNGYMLLGFVSTSMRPKSGLGKVGLLLIYSIPLWYVIISLIRMNPIENLVSYPESAWVDMLITITISVVFIVLYILMAIRRLKTSYYL